MDYQHLLAALNANAMGAWATLLAPQLKEYFATINHGDYPKWRAAVAGLPKLSPSVVKFDTEAVTIGDRADCNLSQYELLKQHMAMLMPWRKGPFLLFGLMIDAEWRANLKWQRLHRYISPLKNKLVLDVGCGNGYYGFRMLAEKPRYVVGIEPSLLYLMQFTAFKKYCPDTNFDILPFGIEALPEQALNFDMVFSMGVLYHRRDPIDHLMRLYRCLKPGGQLVLETLIINTNNHSVLTPEKTYAKMPNVFAVPSLKTLSQWVIDTDFKNPRIVDVTPTTIIEQRKTEWMTNQSLSDFQDPIMPNKTIEGYPGPTRAILLAER